MATMYQKCMADLVEKIISQALEIERLTRRNYELRKELVAMRKTEQVRLVKEEQAG